MLLALFPNPFSRHYFDCKEWVIFNDLSLYLPAEIRAKIMKWWSCPTKVNMFLNFWSYNLRHNGFDGWRVGFDGHGMYEVINFWYDILLDPMKCSVSTISSMLNCVTPPISKELTSTEVREDWRWKKHSILGRCLCWIFRDPRSVWWYDSISFLCCRLCSQMMVYTSYWLGMSLNGYLSYLIK